MTIPIKEIVRCFPNARGLFAYGSAAFQQPGLYAKVSASQDAPMLDILFVADNPLEWHRENIARNRNHYSSITGIRPSMMCSLCDDVGRGVHFNPYVKVGGQDIKYGVATTSALIRDLWTWDNLFIAGRLQKPVLIMVEDSIFDGALRANLDAAFAAALLLLPAHFSSQALMECICGLSYIGDIRMTWAEDRRKIERIVQGSWPALVNTFLPQLQGPIGKTAGLIVKSDSASFQNMKWGDMIQQNLDLPQSELLVSILPQTLQSSIGKMLYRDGNIAVRPRATIAASLSKALRLLVRASSIRQALWGLASAGPHEALRYATAKAEKGRA